MSSTCNSRAGRARRHGTSAWTLSRKLRYLTDSVYAFSDLPIQLLVIFGATGMLFSAIFAVAVLISRLTGLLTVPGDAATVLTVTFVAALNFFGLGVIGAGTRTHRGRRLRRTATVF